MLLAWSNVFSASSSYHMSEDDVAGAWYEQVNVHHISKLRDSQAMEMESVFPDLFSWIYLNIKLIMGHWVHYSFW